MASKSERSATKTRAIRAVLDGSVQGVGFRAATLTTAEQLAVMGWVRNEPDGTVAVHAEGTPESIDQLILWLRSGPPGATVESIALAEKRTEGHEQFAVRGVSAGVFVVQEHVAQSHHFDLRLEIEGRMRSWAVPKGPSMDPAVKRLAIRVPDHTLAHNAFEGPTGSGAILIWDRGSYEQGGRVPWPDAIERGHAVFVLHGQKLSGGFALQRTRTGEDEQWLLIKRRDDQARTGSDVLGELPTSVQSGLTLEQIARERPSRDAETGMG